MRKTSWLWIASSCAVAIAALGPACGGSNNTSTSSPSGGGGATSSGHGGQAGGDPFTTSSGMTTLASITIDPKNASLEILDGKILTQQLAVTAHFSDGSSQPAKNGVVWSADSPAIGAIDATGLYTPSGAVGGLVTVTATYQGVKAQATVGVKLHDTSTPLGFDPSVQKQLQAAKNPDPTIVWAYPYNGTVFPRGLGSVPLMWNNGGANDQYYVHLKSAYYELEVYTPVAPPAQYALPDAEWTKFVDSTSGSVDVVVARWDGMQATQLIEHQWTIAPASLRGTVYYWANNLGRIVRIKPGAAAPDDFSNGVVPSSTAGCTMTCHTVSADGSVLVAAGGSYGGSYDLKANQPLYGLGGGQDSAQARQWTLPAVSPDGKYVVVNALAAQLGSPNVTGMFQTADGMPVPQAGLPNERMYMPVFSPDGRSLAFVTGTDPGTQYWDSTGSPGTLRALDYDPNKNPMFGNERDVVAPGNDPSLQLLSWPSISPDGKWIAYARLNWQDPSAGYNLTSFVPTTGDMFLADLAHGGGEVRLANLNGDVYPFAAGDRDRHKSYEPSFAPVPAGGYFWVVFHSRRTYGNALTGDPTTVKQLWIAAIDQSPKQGADPSHPAFRLPGQDAATLNLRGFFALDPCKKDGQDCMTGTDCCGGYCDPSPDGGPAVCGPKMGCAQDGDHCDTSADCCNAPSGVTCINHVCAEAPPK